MELEIAGNTYVIGKMRSRQQRNVLRRVFPLVLAVKPLISKVALALGKQAVEPAVNEVSAQEGAAEAPAIESEEVDALFSAAGPLAQQLSDMSDEHFDYIFDTCLAVVQRKTAGTLQNITVAGGDLRFADITLPQQIQLIVAVLRENFEDFF